MRRFHRKVRAEQVLLIFFTTLYVLYKMRPDHNDLSTPETCRAARALLDITQAQLARRAGVSRLTVAHFERAERKPLRANLAAIRSALEEAGIALLPGGAVVCGPATPFAAADVRHVIAASTAEIFVTNDSRLCNRLSSVPMENGFGVLHLDKFLADLQRKHR